MSLDGYVAGPQGQMDWIQHGDQFWEFVDQHIPNADTGVYGPKTYQMMEGHWPQVLKDNTATGHPFRHAQWYAKANKIVFSRQLAKLDNPAARLIQDQVAEEINALKNQPGKNIMVFGSPHLVHSLAKLDLIDEYVMTISPVLLGSGIPMFARSEHRSALQLVSCTKFDQGALGLNYIKK
jgi:dihydrofolate reductase